VPELIGGLPLHALVVHFTVVLLPIASVGALLTALWPAVRRRFGWLVVAAAAVSLILVPITTTSGTNLEQGLGAEGDPLVQKHSELADLMIYWAAGLFVAVTLLMIVHTMGERRARAAAAPELDAGAGGVATETRTEARRSTGLTVAMIVLMVATVGLSVGTGIHIYRVGDAGAHAVWEETGKNLK
jgi:uncharacterized membrane protein